MYWIAKKENHEVYYYINGKPINCNSGTLIYFGKESEEIPEYILKFMKYKFVTKEKLQEIILNYITQSTIIGMDNSFHFAKFNYFKNADGIWFPSDIWNQKKDFFISDARFKVFSNNSGFHSTEKWSFQKEEQLRDMIIDYATEIDNQYYCDYWSFYFM